MESSYIIKLRLKIYYIRLTTLEEKFSNVTKSPLNKPNSGGNYYHRPKMTDVIIKIEPPVILGTSESYRGDIFKNGNCITVPLYNVCLLHYPEVGKITYIEKCVFISDSILRYSRIGEIPNSSLLGNSYVLGGCAPDAMTVHICHDEIEFIAKTANLVLPYDGRFSEKPFLDVYRDEAIRFFQTELVERM